MLLSVSFALIIMTKRTIFKSLRNSFLNAVCVCVCGGGGGGGGRGRHRMDLYDELSQTTSELLFLKLIGTPTTTITIEMTAFRKLCIEYIYQCIPVLQCTSFFINKKLR